MISKEELYECILRGYTNEQLAKHFNCGITTIKRNKKYYGFVGLKTNKKPISDLELKVVTEEAEKGNTVSYVSNKLGISTHRLKTYVPTEVYEKLVSNSRESTNNQARIGSLEKLLEPCKETAYLVGYLQADGCITSKGYITATSIDKELIYYCAKFFGAKILKNNKDQYHFSVGHIKLLEKIKRATGLVPNKSYIEYKVPDWISSDNTNLEYFIVGLFNGDGWAYKLKDSNRIELGIVQHSVQKPFLEQINRKLGWNLYEQSTKSSCTLQTKKKEVIDRFANFYLINPFALSRKKEIILSCEDIV